MPAPSPATERRALTVALSAVPVGARHYLLGAATLAAVIICSSALMVVIPPLRYSVLSLVGSWLGTDASPGGSGIGVWVYYAVAVVVLGPLLWPRLLRVLAAGEEVRYRLGAEEQTPWQRTGHQLRFGAVHLLNLVVPLAVAVALAGVGGVYLAVYLRRWRRTRSPFLAACSATATHIAYNRIVLMVVALGLAAAAWSH